MHLTFLNVLGVIGACFSVYVGVRVLATVVDVYFRWRDNDWEPKSSSSTNSGARRCKPQRLLQQVWKIVKGIPGKTESELRKPHQP